MLNVILDALEKEHKLSFERIEEIFEEHGYEYEGDRVMYYGDGLNIVLWADWSDDAIALIRSAVDNNQVKLGFISPVFYDANDNKAVSLPVAKTLKAHGSKHWLPAAIGASE